MKRISMTAATIAAALKTWLVPMAAPLITSSNNTRHVTAAKNAPRASGPHRRDVVWFGMVCPYLK